MKKVKTFKKSEKKSKSKKKFIFFGVLLLCFILGFFASWWFVSYQKSQDEKNKQDINNEIGSLIQQANDLGNNKDISSADEKYTEAINVSSDINGKANLTIAKAGLYLNDNQQDRALEMALQAEKIYLNENVAQFIATIYARKGDNQKAIEYYQKVIDFIDKNGAIDDSKGYYLGRIDELSGIKQNFEVIDDSPENY